MEIEKIDTVEIVRKNYDENFQKEWERLEGHNVEFEITKRYIERYIKPGDKVLDLGGGPGRYSLFMAEMGCDVTLADLSQGNIDFALEKAKEQNLQIKAVCVDARNLENLYSECYDHILLMGPMYHLLEKDDRIKAVGECMKLLKAGGVIFVSFISMYAGIIWAMREMPEAVLHRAEDYFLECFIEDKEFAGQAFTQAYFIRQSDVAPFMNQFQLKKLHLLGQESILAPCKNIILAQPSEVIDKWIDLAEKVCEREDLLSYSEHILYIGRKI